MAEFLPLAPVPPPAVWRALQDGECEACIDAWTMLLGMRIESPDKHFKESASKDESAVTFLASFYRQLATSAQSRLHTGPKGKQLRKLCFLLTRRLLLDASATPVGLLQWRFLGDMCCCYPSSSALKKLLSDAWEKHQETITASLEKAKSATIKQLSTSSVVTSEAVLDIRLLTILASALPVCGQVLISGSDFLDTFSDAYQTQKREDVRKVLVANAYVGLTSLLKGSKPNLSLFLDQLFSLKAAARVGATTTTREPTLLSDLICSSDLLVRLEKYLSLHPQKRGQDLLSSLRSYQNESKQFHRRYQKQKKRADKGKSRAADVLPNADEELHAHRMSLITQVQDLFPDLGSGYIVRLLDFYGDNTETVVAHLLDASLPPDLQNLDQSEQLATSHTIPTDHNPLPPHSTPPEIPSPEPTTANTNRKNIFDKDIDLAELARSTDTSTRSKLHVGRADPTLTADTVLADRSNHTANKAAILSALAAFDSDDDERDDTYDVADVGGTIDSGTTGPDADADAQQARRAAEEADLALFRAYKSNAALFARDSATRRSQPRGVLKRETGMTDEAIEGWAVMLNRDPKRLSRLEDKIALGPGGGPGGGGGVMTQPELAPTSYRKPRPEQGGDSDQDDAGPSFRGGRGGSSHGRGGRGGGGGRGGRRGGRGGNTPGGATPPSGDQNPTVSRQRKEENKASRANHNRRQQRAKKMARGGALPG